MVRQVPAPSAAWLFDLTHLRAPMHVVVRRHEDEARACLTERLVQLGVLHSYEEAAVALDEVVPEEAVVVW